ncbi:unnamed protein product [Phaeothamnion confervicola]
MSEWIAERRLLYTEKGSTTRQELIIRIGRPYIVKPGSVQFEISDGTAACCVEIVGLNDGYLDEVYGADLLQALQLATNVEPTLRRLSTKYDLYFPTGEPYFEEE